MKIFNDGILSNVELIEKLRTELSGLTPVIRVFPALLGDGMITLLVCFEPKEDWKNGIMENGNYFRMSIEDDGVMEIFTQSLYKKSSHFSFENRLPIKFRKTTVKTIDQLLVKLKAHIDKIKEAYI
jgi:hypothetical protein